MSEEVKERAFEPFFTTKEAGRGTGLGLSTVYGFAKQSKGAVRLDSTLGAGTTITLFLPGETGAANLDGDAEVSVGAVPAGLHVLLVEDDAEVRSVAQRFLAALGCNVTACANGEKALEELSASRFDMLLTDIALGTGMRGTELAERARRRLPDLPVLLMSGYASALLDAPTGWDLLRKPYTRTELGRAIARVLAARD